MVTNPNKFLCTQLFLQEDFVCLVLDILVPWVMVWYGAGPVEGGYTVTCLRAIGA